MCGLTLKELFYCSVFEFIAHYHKGFVTIHVKVNHKITEGAKLWLRWVVLKEHSQLNVRQKIADLLILFRRILCR